MWSRLRGGTTALAAGALLGALSGCSVVPGFAPAVPRASTTPAPVPTAPIPVLTFAGPKPRTAAPALNTTGVAWPAILTSLTRYGQWLLANPDTALVSNVAQPGCAMSNLIAQQAAGLLGDRALLKPVPPVFGPVTGPSPASGSTAAALGNMVTLGVTASRPQEPVLSRTGGRQLAVFDALPRTDLRITLYRAADQKWRLCTVDSTVDWGAPDDPSLPLL